MSNIIKFFRELDRRIKVLFIFIGIHSADRGLTAQYNQIYATVLGASPVVLGTLNSARSLASSLVSVPTGWFSDRYGPKMVILLGLVLTVITSAIYGLAGDWWMVIPAILLFGVSQLQVVQFADIFFINLVKPEQRGMIMSLSRTFWAILSIFSPIVAAVIISNSGGINAPAGAGIRPLYYIQVAVGSLVLFSIAYWLKNPEKTIEKTKRAEKKGSFLQDFRDVFSGEGGKNCKLWVVLFVLRSFGGSVVMPFMPLWLVMRGADAPILGVMGTGQIIASLLVQIPAGKLADKIGRKKTFYLFFPFGVIGTLLVIFAPSPEYFILAGIMGYFGATGGLFEGRQIPFFTMTHEMVPAEQRGRWMGIIGIIRIFTFPASILGGVLWGQGLMTEVLLLPIFVQCLIMLPLLHTIPETLTPHPIEI